MGWCDHNYILSIDASNWMRFVRPATTYKEQNLSICQQGGGIVFLTTRNILPKEELKAGPDPEYAIPRNLSILEPDVTDVKGEILGCAMLGKYYIIPD